MHTIIPAMLTKGDRAIMPFGVMGGHYQAFGHAYFLANLFEHGMDLQEAMDLPRLFPTVDGPVEIESGMPEDVVRALQGMGHKTAAPPKPIGGSQAIQIDWEKGTLTGASEPRKDGSALGY
jgi:gamma-glutamyltranspeptidase/glutathione hydrolase